VQAACGPDRNVLLSPHPKLAPSDCSDLVEAFPVVLLEERLKEVIPAADFYISNHSSTVRWSIMLQIPTLIVDFNGSEERIFDELSPSLEFCSMDELAQAVADLMEPGRLEEQRGRLKALEGYFGKLDGCVGERIVKTTLGLLDGQVSTL